LKSVGEIRCQASLNRGLKIRMYLLDTNMLSELIKREPNPNFLSRLRSKPVHSLSTSCLCLVKLRYGSALKTDFESFWSKIRQEILSRVNVVPFGEKEALVAGDILAQMNNAGDRLDMDDILVAASAIANQYTVVTSHVARFSGIQGLAIENWLDPLE
jgi:predicted nucleic acid-binding protein